MHAPYVSLTDTVCKTRVKNSLFVQKSITPVVSQAGGCFYMFHKGFFYHLQGTLQTTSITQKLLQQNVSACVWISYAYQFKICKWHQRSVYFKWKHRQNRFFLYYQLISHHTLCLLANNGLSCNRYICPIKLMYHVEAISAHLRFNLLITKNCIGK